MHLFYAYWMPYILRVVEFNTTHDAPPTELRLNYSTEKSLINNNEKTDFHLNKDQNKKKNTIQPYFPLPSCNNFRSQIPSILVFRIY